MPNAARRHRTRAPEGDGVLTPLDETLLHQAPTTFDHAVTSDHRFFDRWAVGVQHAELSVIYGLANYKNTDVCDGFLCVRARDRQYNLRLSRPLRPDFTMAVGPLHIDVVEPLWPTVSSWSPPGRRSAATLTCDRRPCRAREEHPHHQRAERAGRAGLLPPRPARHRVGLGRHRRRPARVRRRFAWRDHSWGVRPGMGGRDPVHDAPDPVRSRTAALRLAVRLDRLPGRATWPASSRSRGRLRRPSERTSTGTFIPDTATRRPRSSIDDIRHRHRLRRRPHRVLDRADSLVTTGDGREWDFEHMPLRAPWVSAVAATAAAGTTGKVSACRAATRSRPTSTDLAAPADVVLPDGTIAPALAPGDRRAHRTTRRTDRGRATATSRSSPALRCPRPHRRA